MSFDPVVLARSTIVLLSGSDQTAKQQAMGALLAAAKSDELETETFQSEVGEASGWLQAGLTLPFLAERRTVIVRNIARLDPGKRWEEPIDPAHPAVKALKELPPSTLLILLGEEELGDDEKQRKLGSNLTAWAKIVTLSGGKAIKFDFDPKLTKDLIRKHATANGKKMSIVAAEKLAMMVNSKPSIALLELEKLILFVGDNDQITERDVAIVAIADPEYNIFQLVALITEGNVSAAIKQMRTLFGQTSDLMGPALSRVFPVLASEFRKMWQARMCLDAKTDPMRPTGEVENWLTSKRLASEPDWKSKGAIAAARRLNLFQVGQCIEALLHAEAELKGQLPSFSQAETLERMVFRMCSVCANKPIQVQAS